MGIADDLKAQVHEIFDAKWDARDGQKVPESTEVALGNAAVKLHAAVLYADLSASTKMVEGNPHWYAAEMYKAYLRCAARLIRAEDGVITSYDGDRVMAVFIGERKNSNAANCALKLNYAVTEVINPAIKKHYPKRPYVMKQTVGVDRSDLFVARTGIRGSNDLVWVGRAANAAAKLAELRPSHASRITAAVYDRLNEKAKLSSKGESMWERATWDGQTIYRSTWWRRP